MKQNLSKPPIQSKLEAMNWKQPLVQAKDKATALALRTYLAPKMDAYAKLDQLVLDSEKKTLLAQLRLRGEEEKPVQIEVAGYQLRQTEAGWVLVIEALRCSRPWAQAIAADHLCGREFELPEKAVPFIRALL